MSRYIGRGVHGTTVEVLGAQIVDGTLAPGDVLDLSVIGRALDVSLTALREAIKVLMAKGLLDARQKKGTFVRPREEWNVLDSDVIRWRHQSGDAVGVQRDLAEVRRAIEPAAAGLAAERRTDEDLVELEQALEEMRGARGGSAHDSAGADLRFHQALLGATHNELFAQIEHLRRAGAAHPRRARARARGDGSGAEPWAGGRGHHRAGRRRRGRRGTSAAR